MRYHNNYIRLTLLVGDLDGDLVIGALLIGANEVGLLVLGDLEGTRE